MSFQLIRIQKLAILPGYLAMGFLMLIIVGKFGNLYRYLPVLFVGYSLILLFSTPNSFTNIPFFSDDISRSILPSIPDIIKPISKRKTDADKIAEYIEKNTPLSSTFSTNYYLRSAAKRSVRFDVKGANILVEGNPQKLIEWHEARTYLKTSSLEEQLKYLKQAGVDYLLSENKAYPLLLEKQIGNQRLYFIK